MTHDEEKLLREQMHKLLDIVLDTNGFEARQHKTTGTHPTAFFEYLGHVNTLELYISAFGWMPGIDQTRLIDRALDRPFTEKEMQDVRDKCKEALEGKAPDIIALEHSIFLKETEIAVANVELDKLNKKLETLKELKKGEPR